MTYDEEEAYYQHLRDEEQRAHYQQLEDEAWFRSVSLTWFDRQLLPLERVDGEWCNRYTARPECDPEACVIYVFEPSPETGHVGFCWWARGKMGDASSARAAMAAADAAWKWQVSL